MLALAAASGRATARAPLPALAVLRPAAATAATASFPATAARRCSLAAPLRLRPCLGATMSESEKLAGRGVVTRADLRGDAAGERLAAAVGAQPGEPLYSGKLPAAPPREASAGAARGLRTASPLREAAASPAAGGGGERADGRFPRSFIGVSDEQGKRSYMEDRHTVIPDFRVPGAADPALPRQFVAVYDGHSSHRGSEHAAHRVHDFVAAQPAVQACRGKACDQAEVEAALKAAFEDVDEEIVQTALEKGKRYGTTAVCALRIGGTLYVAHAGDSRAVLCRDGRAIGLTRDHKPASVPEERARIEAQGGVVEPNDYVVSPNEETMVNMSRALGDPDFKAPRRLVEAEPDVARVELRAGADRFLLLGSDGLFDVMSGQQAVDLACRALQAAGGPPSDEAAEAAAEALVKEALRAGTRDNVTCLIQLFAWD